MRRKAAGRVHHQRECFYCHGGIPDAKPVYLVHTPTGQIVGPFHAGCAYKLSEQVKHMGGATPGVLDLATVYGHVAREETLPE